MYAYIYFWERFERYWNELMHFWGQCWVTGLDWMDTPWTVVTTRALAVLKKKEIRRRKPLLTSEQQNALSL